MIVSYKEKKFNFAEIARIIVSGSSGVGKTHFVHKLLQEKLFNFSRVIYFHPDTLENCPVDWHTSLDTDLVYKAGLPDVEFLKTLPENTFVILDDLFEEAAKTYCIDYLFRVLSSKLKLHACILTQRYFAKGSYAVSIRNSCNYHVLMPSNDYKSNERVARNFGLDKEFKTASELNRTNLYPYVFIARDNIARTTEIQLFIDIFGRYKRVIIGHMVYYLLTKTDFENCFTKKDQFAAKYETKEQKTVPTETKRKTGRQKFEDRKKLERKIKRIVQRYTIRSGL